MAKKKEIQMEMIEEEVPFSLYRRPKWPAESTGTDTPTEQSHRDACDVNMIVKRYQAGQIHPNDLMGPGSYGDFSDVKSYAEAMEAVSQAQKAFLQIPAEIRAKFDHDPGKFIAFCEDPANGEELVKLGLATKLPTDKDEKVVPDGSSKDSKGS